MSATDWFDGNEALVAELRAAMPVAPERLRERVLARAPEARRSPSFARPRRRVLAAAVVALALAGAVTAAVVHGFLGSSGSSPRGFAESQAVASVPKAARGAVATTSDRSLAPSTTVPAYKEAVPKTHGTLDAAGPATQKKYAPSSARQAVVIPKNRLVHADASLEVQVGSHAALTRATNRATQIVSSLGGYAQSVQYQSSREGEGNAYLALRVPVGKTETAIGRLAALGTLVSQQVSTQDLQQQLTHQTNRIGTLRRAIAVYEQALKSGTLSASDRVQIEIRLSNARHALTVQRKARGQTLASGATADVSLTLTTNKHAIVGTHRHRQGRFGRMLHGAAGFLGLEGMVVLYALVVLSPVLLVGGLGWVLLRERRRREERRLLAGT